MDEVCSTGNTFSVTADQLVDCRGLMCPMPIIKVRQKLNTLKKGAEFLIVADDPTFNTEFLRFCYLADLTVISSEKTPQYEAYHVRVLR